MIVALQYILKSGSLIFPALSFFMIALVFQGLLYVHTNLIFFFVPVVWKMPLVIRFGGICECVFSRV